MMLFTSPNPTLIGTHSVLSGTLGQSDPFYIPGCRSLPR